MRPDFPFPPRPEGLRGRSSELATLAASLDAPGARLALVGPGGSGKSMLAAAVAHRIARRFPGGIHWFRVGAWDYRTLLEMLALRFGTPRDRRRGVAALVAELAASGPRLLVFDNHEDDRAMAELLEALAGANASIVITARRCLLSGVLVYPVTAPLVTSGRAAFPRVASLTRRLRWSPLALDIADAVVASRAASATALARYLDDHGIDAVRVIEHEDDLPEVALLVDWAWPRLGDDARRMLGVLAHVEGDHVDLASLATLARVPGRARAAVGALSRWHLVQESMPGRYALHAVVRHAVRKRTEGDPRAHFEHYVALLEAHPERLDIEQSHLFAAMDWAHRSSDLDAMLRIERLLGEGSP